MDKLKVFMEQSGYSEEFIEELCDIAKEMIDELNEENHTN